MATPIVAATTAIIEADHLTELLHQQQRLHKLPPLTGHHADAARGVGELPMLLLFTHTTAQADLWARRLLGQEVTTRAVGVGDVVHRITHARGMWRGWMVVVAPNDAPLVVLPTTRRLLRRARIGVI